MNDLQEVLVDNASSILIYRWVLHEEWEHYQTGYVMMHTANIIEIFYLSETKSAQQAKLIASTQSCQIAKE